ncbi:unnamed protein product [Symbiodinium sp. CCMP2592]|nr:unnamed protein product [Symbiodinium sp. CCMP2592]
MLPSAVASPVPLDSRPPCEARIQRRALRWFPARITPLWLCPACFALRRPERARGRSCQAVAVDVEEPTKAERLAEAFAQQLGAAERGSADSAGVQRAKEEALEDAAQLQQLLWRKAHPERAKEYAEADQGTVNALLTAFVRDVRVKAQSIDREMPPGVESKVVHLLRNGQGFHYMLEGLEGMEGMVSPKAGDETCPPVVQQSGGGLCSLLHSSSVQQKEAQPTLPESSQEEALEDAAQLQQLLWRKAHPERAKEYAEAAASGEKRLFKFEDQGTVNALLTAFVRDVRVKAQSSDSSGIDREMPPGVESKVVHLLRNGQGFHYMLEGLEGMEGMVSPKAGDETCPPVVQQSGGGLCSLLHSSSVQQKEVPRNLEFRSWRVLQGKEEALEDAAQLQQLLWRKAHPEHAKEYAEAANAALGGGFRDPGFRPKDVWGSGCNKSSFF